MLFPGKRVIGVPSPGIIRRFSPDGQLLCIFGSDQQTIMLYKVKLRRCKELRSFEDFFSLDASIRVPLFIENELLCREFMLFGEENGGRQGDSGFVILASAAPSKSSIHSKFNNPRSFTTFEQLDDVCFHLLSLADYRVKDRLEFRNDYILLANHSGVSLLDGYFLVTSLQNQCIIVYRIVDLKFVPVTVIGHHLGMTISGPQNNDHHHGLVCGLWHKILVHCYEHAADKAWFHGVCNSLSRLVISKTQLIDAKQRVLIKMIPKDFMTQRLTPNEHPSQYFFVVFDFKHNRIDNMFHYSNFLEWLIENDHLLKRTAYEHSSSLLNHPSYTDCPDTLHSLTKHIEPVNGAKRTNVLKKLLYSFPYPSQVLSTCEYLSQQRFRFDDKLVGREFKWRISPDYPVRFILKDDGDDGLFGRERFAFSIEPWLDQPLVSTSNFKRFHNAIWHPHLPLVILTYQSTLRSTFVDIYYY